MYVGPTLLLYKIFCLHWRLPSRIRLSTGSG